MCQLGMVAASEKQVVIGFVFVFEEDIYNEMLLGNMNITRTMM